MDDDPSLAQAALALARSLGVEYASTALGQPLEVARILLQVQWCPRADVWRAFAKAGLEQGQATEYALVARRLAGPRGPVVSGTRNATSAEAGGASREAMESVEYDDDSDDDDDVDHVADQDLPRPLSPSPDFDDAEEQTSAPYGGREFGGQEDELADEDDAEAYFHDLMTGHSKATDLAKLKRREVDESGYVVREVVPPRGGSEDPAGLSSSEDGGDVRSPESEIPVLYQGGLWAMARAVVRSREGVRGLFKGLTLTFFLDEADRMVVPLLEQGWSLLLARLAPWSISILALRDLDLGETGPVQHLVLLSPWQSWLGLVLSHAVTGLAMAPLSTLRTRVIAQATQPSVRKYDSGTFGLGGKSLRHMAAEEGGWLKLWTSPRIFFPALLDCTIRPALLLGTPILVDYLLPSDIGAGMEVLLTLACQTASLLISLPIETIRRRLQVRPVYDVHHHATTQPRPACQHPRSQQPDTSAPSILDAALPPPTRQTTGRSTSGGAPFSWPSQWPKKEAPSTTTTTMTMTTTTTVNNNNLAERRNHPSTRSGLGCQIRIKGLRTCVETRPVPYAGFIDGVYKTLTEETGKDPALPAGKGSSTSSASRQPVLSGAPSLYRGFSIAFMTIFSEALLSLFVGDEAEIDALA